MFDYDFLKKIDEHNNKETFAKVLLLDLNENPIEEIQGRIESGSLSIDGNSSVRRTCSLGLIAQDLNVYDYYWCLKSKIKVFIGIKNDIDKTKEDIIWFKMGTYVITNFSITENIDSYNISINAGDKMNLLNGNLGGLVTALTHDFGTYDLIDENGKVTNKKYLIKDIIQDAVHEFTGEPLQNIIINDLDDLGLELMEYRGKDPMYLQLDDSGEFTYRLDGEAIFYRTETGGSPIKIKDLNNNEFKSLFELDGVSGQEGTTLYYPIPNGAFASCKIAKIEYGQTVGYKLTDLTYPGDLILNLGESITSLLDKIVAMLGDFEYFYDLDGRFIFQRKLAYTQTEFDSRFKRNNGEDAYIENQAYTSAKQYSFENGKLITSYSNSPNIQNVKNDFSIWGVRKSAGGSEIPIHFRYAIQKKPLYYKAYDGIQYLTQEEYDRLKKIDESIFQEGQKINIFKKTTVNEPMDTEKWWDVDDWCRRYLYLADSENINPIDFYLNMSTRELANFINANSNRNAPEGTLEHYCYLLKTLTMTEFIPSNDSSQSFVFSEAFPSNFSSSFDNVINREYNWRVFDTKLENGEEVLAYSGHNTKCSHPYESLLNFKLTRGYYKSYIYNPTVPASEKTENFIDKENFLEQVTLGNYRIVDWREIIYQMALDYRKYQRNEDFLYNIKINNPNYYIDGYTGYEAFYTDIEGFWRQLYDPYYIGEFKVTYTTKDSFDKENLYYSKPNYFQGSDKEPFHSELTYYQIKGNKKYRQVPINLPKDMKLIASPIYQRKDEEYIPVYRTDEFDLDARYYTDVSDYEEVNITANEYAAAPSNYYYTNGTTVIQKCSWDDKNYDKKTTYYARVDDKFDLSTYWKKDIFDKPELLNFWFDFMDTDGVLGKYSVANIGNRPKTINDNNIKSIYFRDTPNIIFVSPEEFEDLYQIKSGYTYIQIPKSLDFLFTISGQGLSAKNKLDDLLYSDAYCAEQVNINTIPIYYLEPNTRLYLRNDDTEINGEYILNRISLTLDSASMSIMATKVVDKIY